MFDPKELAKAAMEGKGSKDPVEDPATGPAPQPSEASPSMHAAAEEMIQAFKSGSASELAACLTNLKTLLTEPDEAP